MFSKIHYVNKNGIPTPGIPRIFMEKERARDGIRTLSVLNNTKKKGGFQEGLFLLEYICSTNEPKRKSRWNGSKYLAGDLQANPSASFLFSWSSSVIMCIV